MSQRVKIALIASLIFLGAVNVYLLLLAPGLANNRSIVQVRNSYTQTAAKVIDTLAINDGDNNYLQPPFKVVQINEDGSYQYLFSGRLSRVDPAGQIIYFQCCDGREFGFAVNTRVYQGRVLVWGREIVADRAEWDWLALPPEPALEQARYWLAWKDQRVLSALLKQYQADPTATINLSEGDVMSLARKQ